MGVNIALGAGVATPPAMRCMPACLHFFTLVAEIMSATALLDGISVRATEGAVVGRATLSAAGGRSEWSVPEEKMGGKLAAAVL
jgi:hypothetical protein